MRISIPTASIQPVWNVDKVEFTEAYATIQGWLMQGKIVPQTPSITNGSTLYQSGTTQFVPTQNELLSIGKGNTGDANAIIYENPMVWEADLEIWDLPMPTTIPAWIVPDGGVDVFPEINKFTTAGTAIKTVGEWIDSICEIWKNSVTGKVHIYTNPINGRFIEYHLIRAFKNEFTVANHVSLTNNTEIITITTANADHADPNWVKQQPS